MANAVVTSAMCMCSFGTAPCNLMATNTPTVMADSKPAAVIMDNTPANMATFGMCTTLSNPQVASATSAALGVLTPMPCVPNVPGPWAPGSATVLFGGKPALSNTSKAVCAFGGMIQFTTPGQFTVMVP